MVFKNRLKRILIIYRRRIGEALAADDFTTVLRLSNGLLFHVPKFELTLTRGYFDKSI